MARYKTFVNGGSVLPSDLNAIADDYECAFGTYKHLCESVIRLDAPSSGTFIFTPGYTGAGQAASGATGALGALWLDPAAYWVAAATEAVNPRSVYYNLNVSLITNPTAIGNVTLTTGLYAASAVAGTGSAQAGLTLAGSPITGSSVTFNNPAASTLVPASSSGDFAAPSAGYYAFAVAVSASAAASSSVVLRATLRMRQI